MQEEGVTKSFAGTYYSCDANCGFASYPNVLIGCWGFSLLFFTSLMSTIRIITPGQPRRKSRSRESRSGGSVIDIRPGSLTRSFKAAVLPKELSFGVHFSYQR